MSTKERPNSVKIHLNYGVSDIVVTFGDLFNQDGLKVIPISRHFFETDVAESSLLISVINDFQQSNNGIHEEYQKELFAALNGKDYERAPATLPNLQSVKFGQKQLTKLRSILVNRFNNSELQDLCFDLRVNFDDLPGDNISSKARELIKYLERHARILELIRIGEQFRPDIHWVDIFRSDEDVPLVERLYPLGTTALIKSRKNKYLLFSITWTELKGHIPDDNCNITKMWLALEKFWQETRKYALDQDVNIPLIGSGITGINLDPIHILGLNLLAIQNAIIEKGKITTGKIRIVLYPPDHSDIDLELVKRFWIKGKTEL